MNLLDNEIYWWLFELDVVIPRFRFSLGFQDLVQNILMIGFLQTLEKKSKKKRGSRFLQQQVEPLIIQEVDIILGRDIHCFFLKLWADWLTCWWLLFCLFKLS